MRPKSRWLSKQINQLCTCKYKILITFGVLSTIICLVPNLFNLMLCRPLKWTLPKRTCYYPSRKKCFSDRTLVTLIEKLTQVQVTKVPPNIFALFRVQLRYPDQRLACFTKIPRDFFLMRYAPGLIDRHKHTHTHKLNTTTQTKTKRKTTTTTKKPLNFEIAQRVLSLPSECQSYNLATRQVETT